jgi:hypothetical protein
MQISGHMAGHQLFETNDPLVGIEYRDRHAVERPTSRGVGSRSGLHATAWSEALV